MTGKHWQKTVSLPKRPVSTDKQKREEKGEEKKRSTKITFEEDDVGKDSAQNSQKVKVLKSQLACLLTI
jgi:hypothetical protein